MAACVKVCAFLALLARYKLIYHSGAAATEELQRFVPLLFSPTFKGHAARDSPTKGAGHFMAVTPLRSPAFWELPELRCTYSLVRS